MLTGFAALTILLAVIGLGMLFMGNDYEKDTGLTTFLAAVFMTAVWGIWSLLVDIATELKRQR
ncbi:hypothetical protein [uncultured Corynebacterium sp.]|uniref:hypothetical protein n=1 Tax=uncultured Corynebacterium sp. TaxID=159447 RepID=UPI0025DF0954|nr:hypothetical protein [uncultured Corynebacterium sp.]